MLATDLELPEGVTVDTVVNDGGRWSASGGVASTLLDSNGDWRALRPFIGPKGRPMKMAEKVINGRRKVVPVVTNAPALLGVDDWILIDQTVVEAARAPMRFWQDLRAMVPYNIPNALGKTVIRHSTRGRISPATISMDPVRRSERDRPTRDTVLIPIPVIHKDLNFTLRDILVSRNSGEGVDLSSIAEASMEVAEAAEQLAIGVSGSYSYGGGTIYGATNHPNRNTISLTLPTSGSWNPGVLLSEVLQMVELANGDNMYGPFMLYFSKSWRPYLNEDFSAAKGTDTVQERLARNEDIRGIRVLNFLTGYQVLLIQMTPNVIQGAQGMDVTTVQWSTEGGMELHFKVMAIMFPRIKADMADNSGIVHGVAS
jgi:hypothetical protein